MKKIITKISLISALVASSISYAADDPIDVNFATTEVAPGLYMLSGVGGFTGGNIGLSIGDDGVVMIDDSMPPLLDKMKAAIKSVTPQSVDFLINTHVHGDHIGNNEAIGNDGTHIVAHENLRSHLLKKGIGGSASFKPAPKAALPVITFSHTMNFHLNGNDAHIFHVAKAHTDGDAVIHFKDLNVIHTGDTLFNGMFPYIDLSSGGSLDGYISAQKKILEMTNATTKIIPGHGQLANKNDLASSISMLEDSKKLISDLIHKGKSEEEVVKLNPLNKYHDKWNWEFITTEKMTRQLYQGIVSGNKSAKVSTESSQSHSH